jgi:o-succinylbenzoate---CoA ligase
MGCGTTPDGAPAPGPDTPALWLARAAADRPYAQALQWEGGELDFATLAAEAAARAAALDATGMPGTVLALALSGRREMALGLYAALGMVRPLALLDPHLDAARRRVLGQRLGPWTLVTDRRVEVDAPVSSHLSRPAGPSPVRLVLATSGSSGRPRAVLLGDANLAAAVTASRRRIPLEPGDCWLGCLPLFHMGGLSILLRCLEAGARVLLHQDFDAQRVWRDLWGQRVTHLSLVPVLLRRLLDAAQGESPPPCLRAVLLGGATLDEGLARATRRAGWPLCVSYGMTETASQIATSCDRAAEAPSGWVGRPLDGLELRIDGPDRQGMGRILVRGAAVMLGYARPGLTPGLGLRDSWLDTGDLGRLDPSGALVVLGRADDLINSGGEKIHPLEVEPVLQACPGVEAAAVSSLDDPAWGQLLVAVYCGPVAPQVLEAHCRRELHGARRPRRFLQLPALPLLASGKLDRHALRRQVESLGAADRSTPGMA